MPEGYAIGGLILGISMYFLAWFRHDLGGVPRPGSGGELAGAPAWLRPMIRHGNGPILLVSVLIEVAGITIIARALAVAAGFPADPFDRLTGTAMTVSILLIALGWAWLYVRSRLS